MVPVAVWAARVSRRHSGQWPHETPPWEPEVLADNEVVADIELSRLKAALRREAMARRDGHAADPAQAAEAAAALFVREIAWPDGGAVSAYWPMGSELDPRPLLRRCHGEGLTVLLPLTRGRARPLQFRRWQPGDTLVSGGFGTSVPKETAPEGTPDLLVVPLLAVDPDGYRLGYGGGYYDRTLRALRTSGRAVTAVGFAYEAQYVAQVPRHDGDERLDWLVTEETVRRFPAVESV